MIDIKCYTNDELILLQKQISKEIEKRNKKMPLEFLNKTFRSNSLYEIDMLKVVKIESDETFLCDNITVHNESGNMGLHYYRLQRISKSFLDKYYREIPNEEYELTYTHLKICFENLYLNQSINTIKNEF